MEPILNLPPDQFMAALAELQLDPQREAELVRQYRRANSVMSPLYGLLERISSGDAQEGMQRAALLPVTRPEGMSVVDAIGSGDARLAVPQSLFDLIGGGAQAIDAPAAAAQGLIPAEDMVGEALNLGGFTMGAGGVASRPAGSVGMGGRPTRADLDPYGYQSTRLRDYLDRTQVDARELPILPRTPRSWEETEGMIAVPFYGDRTAGQREILGIDGNQFSSPVLAEGGVDFMRGPAAQADNAIWASNSNITSRLQNVAEQASEDYSGRQVLGITGSMAPNANDFATFTAETIAEMVPFSRVTASDAARFNEIMSEIDPDFPGLFSDNLRNWAATTTSPMRKSFIRLMESSPMQEAGMPSPGQGRYAVTDPTQRDMPAGMFGMGAAIMDPSAPRLYNTPRGNQYQAQVPHSTYNTQITGQYFGSLPPVPQGLLFRDLYDRMEGQLTRSGQPLSEAHRTHAIKTIVPSQEMTPRVIEGILQYLARSGQ